MASLTTPHALFANARARQCYDRRRDPMTRAHARDDSSSSTTRRKALLLSTLLATTTTATAPAIAALVDAESAQRVFAQVSTAIVAIAEVKPSGEVVSRGSGVAWSTSADACYIATNAHCIASSTGSGKSSAGTLCLYFNDGSKNGVSVPLTGKSEYYVDGGRDVGFIRVDAEDFPKDFIPPKAAIFGTSKGLIVGQGVFALGCAQDMTPTLHGGVISGLGRRVPSKRGGNLAGLIQTDAVVSESTSGGALCDSGGRVIGLLVTSYGTTKVNGVNFAIPIDVARLVADSM